MRRLGRPPARGVVLPLLMIGLLALSGVGVPSGNRLSPFKRSLSTPETLNGGLAMTKSNRPSDLCGSS